MDKKQPNTDQILKGLLDTLVLSVLARGENYGFGIREALHTQLGDDASTVKEATLYPLLHRLERKGLLLSYRQPGARGTPRKYYRITDTGKHFLAKQTEEWQKVIGLLTRTILASED
ncbi:MAG: PadR family transcriptional regulator [Idiomarinaceae bacterium HL-53]|nr:MAG: PadR family transcriptional regulator [Idiomarinaceae bacterium HL-53]CUS48088.1 PadR family transcriptional regulator, regulatory protein PadR [Idiomarinaceae bacterium HL-53]